MTGGPTTAGREVTVADLGEDALVSALLDRLRTVSGPPPPRVVVDAGDDAAVLAATGDIVLSTDTLVSGVDFRLDWSTAADVGAKAAAASLADVAAMGAVPESLLVSLTLPAGLEVSWVLGLAEGFATECRRAGAVVVGGDVASGDQIVVTGTATGRMPPGTPPVRRSGARPGDVLAVAGVLGPSAAGLALLLAGADVPAADREAAAAVVSAHRRPAPRYDAGAAAALSRATSMIDVSDGLVRDARRIAAASSVVLGLDPVVLDPAPDVAAIASLLGADAAVWVLTGGEDHGMLATFPATTPLPAGFRAIGRVTAPAVGVPGGTVTVAGRPYTGPGGWTHFGA